MWYIASTTIVNKVNPLGNDSFGTSWFLCYKKPDTDVLLIYMKRHKKSWKDIRLIRNFLWNIKTANGSLLYDWYTSPLILSVYFCSTWDTHEDFDNITATVLTNFESNIKFQRNKINMNAYVHDHK